MSRLGGVALLLGLLLAVLWAGRRLSSGTDNPAGVLVGAEWAAEHSTQLRRILNIPASMQLEFKEVAESPAPDYHLLVFEALEGEERFPIEIFVSRDGRQVFFDRPYDLEDPFGAIRKQIQVEEAPARGPADAALTIVEYSDYTCPYCRQFFLAVEEPLLDQFGDRVRLVYKNFPLAGMRAWSMDAALAAACAFRQGNQPFWTLHEKLFREMPRLKEGRPVLHKLAGEAGLDVPAFTRCFDQRDALAEVNRDLQEGERLGVQGTPTFFVNGRPIPGLVSPENFFHIVEEELAAAQRQD